MVQVNKNKNLVSITASRIYLRNEKSASRKSRKRRITVHCYNKKEYHYIWKYIDVEDLQLLLIRSIWLMVLSYYFAMGLMDCFSFCFMYHSISVQIWRKLVQNSEILLIKAKRLITKIPQLQHMPLLMLIARLF